MASKMITNFRRSISFPNQPSHISSNPRKNLHIRSTSLLCQSHPIISKLWEGIAQVKSCTVYSESSISAWLCDSLNRLKSTHESLDDLLHLPQTVESMRTGRYSDLVEKLQEDFLQFVDLYGSFQTLLLRLREEYSVVQISVRRKEDTKIAFHSKNLNKIAKEIGKLVTNLQCIRKYSVPEGSSHFESLVVATKVGSRIVSCRRKMASITRK